MPGKTRNTKSYNEGQFQLIETILFYNEFEFIDLHMERLRESAAYFNFIFDQSKIVSEFNKLKDLPGSKKFRVRALLDRNGKISITYSEIKDILNHDYNAIVSEKRTNSENIFYYHKTTKRELYNCELNKAREKGFYEVLFLNERGEITEGSITNIYVKGGNILYTPPLNCGLLNGTIRKHLIKTGKARERLIYPEDLIKADKVYISNSIIGLKEVKSIKNIPSQ